MAEDSNDSVEMETVDHLHTPVSAARSDLERSVDSFTHLESLLFHPETQNLLLLTSSLTGDYWGGKIFLLESTHTLPTPDQILSSPVDLKAFIGTHAQRTAAGNTGGCWVSSKEFAVSTERGTVEVYQKAYSTETQVTSGCWKGVAYEAVSVMYAHDSIVSSVHCWAADSDTLVSSSYDCCCRLWSLKSYTSTECYRAHMGPVHCLACQPEGVNLFATGASERNELVRMWDRREKMAVGAIPGLLPYLSVRSLAWGSANLIALGTETGHLVLHDIRNLTSDSHLSTSAPHSDVIRDLAFCPQQESLLATASHDNTAKIFSVKTEELVKVPAEHSDMLTTLDWYPQSSLLLTGSLNSEIIATKI